MADGNGRDEPDLELPSLFGKRRKKRSDEAAPPVSGPAATSGPPATPPPRRTPPTPPPSAPPSAPPPRPSARPARPASTASPEEPTTEVPQVPAARATEPEETAPIAARPPRPSAPPPRRRGPEMTWSPPADAPAPRATASDEAPVESPVRVEEAPEPKPRRRPSLPSLPSAPSLAAMRQRVPKPSRGTLSAIPLAGRVAAGVTGAVVVAVGVALLWVSLQGCTAVRGVSSCGGVGLLAILFTLVVQVLLGAVLLAAWRVSEPRSTSMLGVGLLSVVAMVLLYASTPTGWLSVALLLLGPAAYVVAQGITSSSFELRD